jgi:hypothetical protein
LIEIKAAARDVWLHLASHEEAGMTEVTQFSIMRTGAFAGIAGGLAEIAWVTLYSGITGTDPAVLARGVTTAAGISALLPEDSPVALGFGVHMALAVMLGIILVFAWRALSAKRPHLRNPYPFMLTALAAVWTVNFFVVLPIVSPAFIHIVPYAVSLISKLLFGVAAAEIVRDETIFAPRQSAFSLFKSPSNKRSRI